MTEIIPEGFEFVDERSICTTARYSLTVTLPKKVKDLGVKNGTHVAEFYKNDKGLFILRFVKKVKDRPVKMYKCYTEEFEYYSEPSEKDMLPSNLPDNFGNRNGNKNCCRACPTPLKAACIKKTNGKAK